MTIRLLNAAVMPRPGQYALYGLTAAEYAAAVRDAYASGDVRSYIGYDAVADVIERITGIRPAVTRATTPVEDGDVLLIARLRQRVQSQSPHVKAAMGRHHDDIQDYEFFRCIYRDTAHEHAAR